MLVLTRKTNETIQLGGSQITITVVNVGGGRVRLGIQAPSEVRIERLENFHSSALRSHLQVDPSQRRGPSELHCGHEWS